MFSKILKSSDKHVHVPGSDPVLDHWALLSDGKENRPRGSAEVPSQTTGQTKMAPWVNPVPAYDGGQRPRISSIPERFDLASRPAETTAMDRAFELMLDELQIPSTLRPKLSALDIPVKAAMLKSSHVLNIESPLVPPQPRSQLRKSRSSTSLESPRSNQARPTSTYSDIPFGGLSPPLSSSSSRVHSLDSPEDSKLWIQSEHALSSASLPRSSSSYGTHKSAGQSSGHLKPSKDKTSKDRDKDMDLSPAKFASSLKSTESTALDIEKLKKLRLLLRNESAGWTELFVREGGYSALLTRLTDLLQLEWREEQRDDKILHELLRCFKALSTSSIGCFALRSSCPTPFNQLVTLVYSDKKPGDISTRQLIVDLLHILFELYPSVASEERRKTAGRIGGPRDGWEGSSTSFTQGRHVSRSIVASPSPIFPVPAPHSSLYSLVRSLLLTRAPPPAEQPGVPVQPHEFIESLHVPRIYKTYLQELSDVCRDYFWVFCHPQNAIWSLAETDEEKVEMPRAPGGMTGGVEYEAVGYITTHLRFINALAQAAVDLKLPPTDEHSAHRFHSDLFASGFERILVSIRKASTAYYPTMHLEIARYVALAVAARYDLPWAVSRLVGLPPSSVLKSSKVGGPSSAAAITISGPRSRSNSPSKTRRAQEAILGGGTSGQVPAPVLPKIERMSLLQ